MKYLYYVFSMDMFKIKIFIALNLLFFQLDTPCTKHRCHKFPGSSPYHVFLSGFNKQLHLTWKFLAFPFVKIGDCITVHFSQGWFSVNNMLCILDPNWLAVQFWYLWISRPGSFTKLTDWQSLYDFSDKIGEYVKFLLFVCGF